MKQTSFPYMRIANYLGADYGRILGIAEKLDRGIAVDDPLVGNVRIVWTDEQERRKRSCNSSPTP